MRIIQNKIGATNLVPFILVIILVFSILFVGAYANGIIHKSLIDDYPTNVLSGSVDSTYWHNATVVNTTRNVTLETSANQLDGTLTDFYIFANGTYPIYYNLTVNGYNVNDTSLLLVNGGDSGYNYTLTTLIGAGAVDNSDEYLNFTWDINSSESQIRVRVYGTYYVSSDWRSATQNSSYSRTTNISRNWDASIGVVQVVIIVTILAAAIGAVFLFTKFR